MGSASPARSAALLAGAMGALLLAGLLAERPAHPRAPAHRAVAGASAAPIPAWTAGVRAAASAGERPSRPHTVMIDPGHGAPDNRGNKGAFCADEADTMLELGVGVAERLEAHWNLRVLLSREPGAVVDYAARLRDAEARGAEAFVSLHSDVRGRADRWSPKEGQLCPIAQGGTGFAVLFADEPTPLVQLAQARLGLARSIADSLARAGFVPYDGEGYTGAYEPDRTPGVFADRHAPDQRIFVLRRATMPSVLIETHNAWNPADAVLFTDPDAIDAFAEALGRALASMWEPEPTRRALRTRGAVD